MDNVDCSVEECACSFSLSTRYSALRMRSPKRAILGANRLRSFSASAWRLSKPEIYFSISERSNSMPEPVAAPSNPSRTRSRSRSVCSLPMNHVPAFESAL